MDFIRVRTFNFDPLDVFRIKRLYLQPYFVNDTKKNNLNTKRQFIYTCICLGNCFGASFVVYRQGKQHFMAVLLAIDHDYVVFHVDLLHQLLLSHR